mgnify:CR=1 FL=1
MCAVTEGETIAARAVIDDKIRLISKKTHPFWLDCTTRGRTGQERMKKPRRGAGGRKRG